MATPSLLTSSLLPVPHGFSTRVGGESQGPYASLNLGFSVGDDRAVVERNVRRLARWLEVAAGELHTVSQVHGDVVLEARAAEGAAGDPALAPVTGEADALRSSRPGAAVGVKTADCVPILLADPSTRQVAAVHSGWKGTQLEIVKRAVEALQRQGARPQDVLVAVGPCIRACCYEVSDELATRFTARFGLSVVQRGRGERSHLDLVAAVVQTLHSAGVPERQVDVVARCTSCEVDAFFSHRRDRGVTGRHLSAIVCRF